MQGATSVSRAAPEMKGQVNQALQLLLPMPRKGIPVCPLRLTRVAPLKQGKPFATSPITSNFSRFRVSVRYLIYLKALQFSTLSRKYENKV